MKLEELASFEELPLPGDINWIRHRDPESKTRTIKWQMPRLFFSQCYTNSCAAQKQIIWYNFAALVVCLGILPAICRV